MVLFRVVQNPGFRAAKHGVVGGCAAAKTKASWQSCLYRNCFRPLRPLREVRHVFRFATDGKSPLAKLGCRACCAEQFVGGIYWVCMTSRPGILNPKPQTMLPAYQPSHRRRSAPIELERRTALRQRVMLPMVMQKRVAADAAEH